MAVMEEGTSLPLSSNTSTTTRSTSVVYVKLTDSALNSLEEFARKKGSDINGGSPTIQFTKSGGVIIVPGVSGTDRFGFSLSKLEDGGSFQCLKSTNHGGSLESMGTMRETLRIQANDDVFQKTIQRQLDVKKESEKKSTVFLDNKGGSKKGVALPTSRTVKKTLVNNPSTHSRHFPSAISSSGPSFSGPGRGVGRPAGPRPPSPDHGFHRHHSEVVKKSHAYKPPGNSDITKRPLRERLIHLLAVKPYRKIELMPKLNKDGMKKKDQNNVMAVLREVSEAKNNSFELKRSLWNDVMEDWPFYTESDKAAMRRRKPQNLTPPVSDTGSTSSGHSPSSTNPASPPQITNPLKRQSYYEPSPEKNAKKKRVSHYKREPGGPGFSRSPYGTSPMMMGGSGGTGVSPRLLEHVSPKTQQSLDRLDLPTTFEDESAPDWGQFHDNDQPPPAAAGRPPPTVQQQPPPPRVNSPAMAATARRSPMVAVSEASGHGYNSPAAPRTNSPAVEGRENSSPQLNNMHQFGLPNLNLNRDFETNYTPITNSQQRAAYKADFNTHYTKYIQYHQKLDAVKARFTSLDNSRRGAQRGSQTYTDIKNEIAAEYERNKRDAAFLEARSNFQYLHEKLAYLKNLVHDYDTQQQQQRRQ